MREIKFRLWDGVVRQMLEVRSMHWKEWKGKTAPVPSWGEVKFLEPIGDKTSGSNDFIDPSQALMQFTGLKDKNGTEIYEGDVVNFLGMSDGFKFDLKGEVKYVRSGFYVVTDRNPVEMSDERGEEVVQYEVIGNIYENPQLLK